MILPPHTTATLDTLYERSHAHAGTLHGALSSLPTLMGGTRTISYLGAFGVPGGLRKCRGYDMQCDAATNHRSWAPRY